MKVDMFGQGNGPLPRAALCSKNWIKTPYDLVNVMHSHLPKHALKRKPNVCPEDVKLRYYSWVDNDWSINRNGINRPIKNWKSTLTNTLKYLNERYTKPIEPIKESLEDRVKRLNLEHKQKG